MTRTAEMEQAAMAEMTRRKKRWRNGLMNGSVVVVRVVTRGGGSRRGWRAGSLKVYGSVEL